MREKRYYQLNIETKTEGFQNKEILFNHLKRRMIKKQEDAALLVLGALIVEHEPEPQISEIEPRISRYG